MFPDCFTLYTKESIYRNLNEEVKKNAHIRLFNMREPASKFINNIPTEDFDYLFANTIQPSMVDLPKWKSFQPKCPSILTIHNINAWSQRGPHIKKNLLHTADSFVSSFYTQKIINKFTYLNTINESLLLSMNKAFPHKETLSIPFSVTHDSVSPENKDTIDFVIPGTVDNRRRDYETIIDVFDVINQDHKNTRLILLGKSDQGIKGKNIVTFDEFVPRETYDNYLKNADFIICPSLPETSTVNTAKEYYGITKSPNIFESIKWRKPLIIPKEIPIPKSMAKSTIQYENYEDLYENMSFYLDNKNTFDKLKEEAYQNSAYYTVDNVKRRISKWIKEI